MSDFLQHGLISTLQRLTDGQTSRIAAELEGFAAATPVTLVLPCHAADVGRPALNRLASSVARFGVIDDVIVALNGADAAAFETARQYFKRLPQRYRIVWTDGPRVCDVWRSCGATAGAVLGKGLNVWSACALISHERRSKVAVTLDCDITSCTEEMFARLLYAVLHPQFGYVFAKVYYSRVADRIYGRVTRLLVAPLLQALVRVAGHAPLLDFLQSFRYALAGECAFRSEVAERMQMDAGWGLEIGMLCEVFRQVNPRSVCQVDGGGDYEHKHQPLGGSGGGLERMAFELCRAVFDESAREGMCTGPDFLAAVQQSYRGEAQEALARYAALSLINGLHYDAAEEERAIRIFAAALAAACQMSLASPSRCLLPPIARLKTERPEFLPALAAAVERDNFG